MRRIFTMTALACLVTACPKPQEATQAEEKADGKAPTAMESIQAVHDSLELNCGKNLPALSGLDKLEIAEADQEKADAMLATIGSMAQSCAPDFEKPRAEDTETCDPSCHWCPIKWYWCIENAGACAGGDNESCCKLGACGSKHHCKDVCKSSCGCNVPPLPADGGGDGDG